MDFLEESNGVHGVERCFSLLWHVPDATLPEPQYPIARCKCLADTIIPGLQGKNANQLLGWAFQMPSWSIGTPKSGANPTSLTRQLGIGTPKSSPLLRVKERGQAILQTWHLLH
jgi:hypothetical protein